jgi:hypothetical protein
MNWKSSFRAWVIGSSFVLLLTVAAGPLRAQDTEFAGLRLASAPLEARPEAYGTTALTLLQVPATLCAPIFDTTSFSGIDGYVHPTAGAGAYDCPLNAPTGAKLVKIAIVAADASDSGHAGAVVAHCVTPDGLCLGAGVAATTGTASSPSSGRVSADLTGFGLTVDKNAELYWIRVVIDSNTGDVKFREADIYYQLQVSTPAPGTQTFGDVPPSFAFYKAIEALAASGITGGCGGGNFCPSSNVTRGEVAAFLARALGLQFPN